MVIHIVNGFEREKPSFLQFIRKTEQFCGLVLTGKNQNTVAPAPVCGRECDDLGGWEIVVPNKLAEFWATRSQS